MLALPQHTYFSVKPCLFRILYEDDKLVVIQEFDNQFLMCCTMDKSVIPFPSVRMEGDNTIVFFPNNKEFLPFLTPIIAWETIAMESDDSFRRRSSDKFDESFAIYQEVDRLFALNYPQYLDDFIEFQKCKLRYSIPDSIRYMVLVRRIENLENLKNK